MTGIAMRMIHAPWLNFVAAMITVITAVTTAPKPLIASPFFHPGSRRVVCRFAMPAWENVNEVKTPIA